MFNLTNSKLTTNISLNSVTSTFQFLDKLRLILWSINRYKLFNMNFPSNSSVLHTNNTGDIPLADPLMLIQHANTYQFVVASIYSVAFVVGSTGNLYVISIVAYILRTLKKGSSNIRHVLIYILCLSCVDLTVLLTIPLFVTDLLLTTWIYGKVVCKLYLTMESLSKILSVFILTMLGADRFLAIRFPIKSISCRKSLFAEIMIGCCFFLTAAIISPIPIYGNILVSYYSTTLKGQDYRIQITKCAFDEQTGFSSVFVMYTFVLCYCFPALLIVMFYSCIACTVCTHISGASATSIPLRRVMRYIFLVTGLYFVCWTPYWFYNILLPMLLPTEGAEFAEISPDVTIVITIVSLMCHLLPFVNCAINPIIYALLNRELRQTLRTSLDLKEHRINARWGPTSSYDPRSKSMDSRASHSTSMNSFIRLLNHGRHTIQMRSTGLSRSRNNFSEGREVLGNSNNASNNPSVNMTTTFTKQRSTLSVPSPDSALRKSDASHESLLLTHVCERNNKTVHSQNGQHGQKILKSVENYA